MTQPQSAPKPAKRVNHRRHRRQLPKGSTKARAYRNHLGLGPNIAVAVLDVSESGVRLLLKEDLPIGREFEVELESIAHKAVKLHAEVIWSLATADGKYCVGSRFTKDIDYGFLISIARQ
jgi:hypothetical protein